MLTIQYVSTKFQMVDVFTKPLATTRLEVSRNRLCVVGKSNVVTTIIEESKEYSEERLFNDKKVVSLLCCLKTIQNKQKQ